MISIVKLGTVDYRTGLDLQQKLVSLRKEGRIRDVLLLLQHTPVITLGRNAKAHNVLASSEELARRGIEVFECDRGGDVTFHGPGQLVGYPIFDLRGFASSTGPRKTLGAVEFVRRIEACLIQTCAAFGISSERVQGLTGVWTSKRPDESAQQAKIAAIGVHISRGVTSHGFALNVNTDLSYFNLIVPCGITAKPVTSMQRELGRSVDMDTVEQRAGESFATVFQTEVRRLDNLDSLLHNAVGVPLKTPSEIRAVHGDEESFWA